PLPPAPSPRRRGGDRQVLLPLSASGRGLGGGVRDGAALPRGDLMREDANPDPEQLLQQAKAGDQEALGQVLERYRSSLAVVARVQIGRRLQGKVDASDVVQEAFLGASRDFPQFRGSTEKEFLGWLRQVLASLLANLVRHYQGTQRRDVRLERQLGGELD